MALEHAVVEILDPDAIDPGRGLSRFIPVQFNPTEYTLAKGAQIAEIAIPGLDSPVLQFIRGQTQTLKLELLFDTTEGGMGDGRGRRADPDQRLLPAGQDPAQDARAAPDPGHLGRGAVVQGDRRVRRPEVHAVRAQRRPAAGHAGVSMREYKTLEEQLAELNLQSLRPHPHAHRASTVTRSPRSPVRSTATRGPGG